MGELMEDVFNHGLASDCAPALEAIEEDPASAPLPKTRSGAVCTSNFVALNPLVGHASGDSTRRCETTSESTGLFGCPVQPPSLHPHALAPGVNAAMSIGGLPAEGHILLAIPLSRLDEVVKLLDSAP